MLPSSMGRYLTPLRKLTEYHSFTDEELDFIINYDIKYWTGGRRPISALIEGFAGVNEQKCHE